MKQFKVPASENETKTDIYKLAYNKYMKFYLSGNKKVLEEVKEMSHKYKLNISEQDLLWRKSYKYKKRAENKGIYNDEK